MLTISNIRKEQHSEWTRIVVDIDFGDIDVPFVEKTIWFAVKNENADMLTADTYDAFTLIPLYLAMYFNTDLRIDGKISKKLYQNMKWYIQQIFCDFSNDLNKVNVSVEGFSNVEEKGTIVGAGISCGVDSLSTIYDHFVKEKDPDYRINSLFIFNCGTHGDYENSNSHKLFENRYTMNKGAADELNLPIYQVSSNIHAFTHKIGEKKMGYLAIYSCIYSVQKRISKYYISSSDSYQEHQWFVSFDHNHDMSGFCEHYLIPLLQNEHMQLIIDGCQYRRSKKIENFVNWHIAKKYLNVCVNTNNGINCCKCSKCMSVLLILDVMGKLNQYNTVFDIFKYYKYAYKAKCNMVIAYRTNSHNADLYTDAVDFARANHFSMQSSFNAYIYLILHGEMRMIVKNILRRILGDNNYFKIKQLIRR